MTLTSDVRVDFKSIGQSYSTNLAQGRIRFFWRRGVYPHADAAPLRATLQCRYIGLSLSAFPRLSNKLTNPGQSVSPYRLERIDKLAVSKGAPF